MVGTKELVGVAESTLDARKKLKIFMYLLEQVKGRMLDTEEAVEWTLRNQIDFAAQFCDEELIGVAESTLDVRKALMRLMYLLEQVTDWVCDDEFVSGVATAENTLYEGFLKMLMCFLEQVNGWVLDTERAVEWKLRNQNDFAAQLADQRNKIIDISESNLARTRKTLVLLLGQVTEWVDDDEFVGGVAENTLYAKGFLKMLMCFLERVNGWVLDTVRAVESTLRNRNAQLADQHSQIWKYSVLVSARETNTEERIGVAELDELMCFLEQVTDRIPDTERTVESTSRNHNDSATWVLDQLNQDYSVCVETGAHELCYAYGLLVEVKSVLCALNQLIGANPDFAAINQCKVAFQHIFTKNVADVEDIKEENQRVCKMNLAELEKLLVEKDRQSVIAKELANAAEIKLAIDEEINQLLAKRGYRQGYQHVCTKKLADAGEIKLLLEKLASMIKRSRVSAILTQLRNQNLQYYYFHFSLVFDINFEAITIAITKGRNTSDSQWEAFTNDMKMKCASCRSKMKENTPSQPPPKRSLSRQSSCSSSFSETESETDGWVADYEESDENKGHRIKIVFQRKRSTVNPYMITYPFRVVGPGPGKRLLYENPVSGELEIRLQRSGYSPSTDTSDAEKSLQYQCTRKEKRKTKRRVKNSTAGPFESDSDY